VLTDGMLILAHAEEAAKAHYCIGNLAADFLNH
jgi:hypothetical protein